MPFISEISPAAAAASDSCPHIRVEMVSNSVSRRLLLKFRDRFEFDYLPSRLWSPPFQPSMFLSAPGNAMITPDDMLLRLRKLEKLRQRRRYEIRLNAFWCFAGRSRGRAAAHI